MASKLHVIFERGAAAFYNEGTGGLAVEGATVLEGEGCFTGTVLLTRTAMEKHGTSAQRIMATLPAAKFGFTVDGKWNNRLGAWVVHRIHELLRHGVPPE